MASTAASSASASDSGAASTPTVAFASSTDNTTSRSDQTASGSRGEVGGRGRGGRGDRVDGRGRGRGKGRAIIPSGRVFFTGSEKPVASESKKVSKTGTPKNNEKEALEEVVGQLDTAIGSNAGAVLGAKLGFLDFDEDYQTDFLNETIEKHIGASEGAMYDSDSSDELERAESRTKKKAQSTVPPLELPLPTQPLPLGIGSTRRPVSYPILKGDAQAKKNEPATPSQKSMEEPMSPFVDSLQKEHLSWEKDSWFLVQLPTRLPNMKSSAAKAPEEVYSTEDPFDAPDTTNKEEEANPFGQISEVVTPPILESSHDNRLSHTAPGRIGKIVVYKSGKTLLKIEGSDGSSPILMDVNEGLTCGFLQQAVAIDVKESKYVCLGDVKKSVVITPNLEAFIAE